MERGKKRGALAIAALVGLVAVAVSTRAAAQDGVDIDRSTPRRAVATFVDAAAMGEFDRAAAVLDLRAVPADERATRGPKLARELERVIERNAWLELATISDDPKGRADDGDDIEQIATARLAGRDVPITLARSPDGTWRVSASTVARIPKLYDEHGPGVLEERVPAMLRARVLGLAYWQWLGLVVAAVLGVVLGRIVAWLAVRAAGGVAERTVARWDNELVESLRSPGTFGLAIVGFRLLVEPLALSAAATQIVGRVVGTVAIVTVAWMGVRVAAALSHIIERRAEEAAKAAAGAGEVALEARGVATQVRVLRRVVNVGIGILAVALVLTQFDIVRSVGVSLLASAGMAGIVLGFAAQRTFGSLIAGIQLAVTQPIRIGDVVIVEKEWGVIEEITLTYVVVKIWDERRLLVPMTRFLEQPFENWTKVSSQLQGTVFFHVDWSLPVAEMRAELDRILDGNAHWDGRESSVHVTDAKERTLEVRVLVSAKDARDLWKLRVGVRERIVAWLQSVDGGRYLPRVRLDEAKSRVEAFSPRTGP